MKIYKLVSVFVILISLSLISCGQQVKESSFFANFIFDYIYNQDRQEYVADLLFDSNYLSDDFNQIEIQSNLVAGDELKIKHTGDFIIAESYPGILYLDGELISYSFVLTDIIGIHVDDSYITKDVLSAYVLNNENVILNDDGEFISLDEYQGHDIFLSVDKSKEETCPDGAWCTPQLRYIAGLYAYKPR